MKTEHYDAIYLSGEVMRASMLSENCLLILVVAKNPISNLMKTSSYIFQNKTVKTLNLIIILSFGKDTIKYALLCIADRQLKIYCLTQNLYFSAQNSEGILRKAHEDLFTKITTAELFTSKTNKI